MALEEVVLDCPEGVSFVLSAETSRCSKVAVADAYTSFVFHFNARLVPENQHVLHTQPVKVRQRRRN